VLEDGFLDERAGFIRGYRETTTGRFVLNYKHQSDWFCPGSMAKVAVQLLGFADDLRGDPRATRMRAMAARTAAWLDAKVRPTPNGWYPRRVTPAGELYRQSSEGGADPFWQTSADGLFMVQLEAAADARAGDPSRSRRYELDGLTILRAAAKHHHGAGGFLTEGVDWNNHVGQQHHLDQARFGDIQYTEPFLNNQHIAEPTLFYLLHLARRTSAALGTEWRDVEGNLLLRRTR
jgi:hypothetical protein